MQEARDALASDPGETGLSGFLGRILRLQDQWYLSTVEGLCHILLGRGKPAEVVLRSALEEAPASRTRLPIMLAADLAAAYVLQDEPEAATMALADCHGRAVARSFDVGMRRARNVRATFPESWRRLKCVASLDEAMRSRASKGGWQR